MFSVYQRGRGHDPVTVAGSIRSFVAVNTYASGGVVSEACVGSAGA
jgi:hypothetical protein